MTSLSDTRDLSLQERSQPFATALVALYLLHVGTRLIDTLFSESLEPLIPPPTWNNEPSICGLDGFVCWRIRLPMTFFLSVPMVSGHNCFGSVLYPVRIHFFLAQQPILFVT